MGARDMDASSLNGRETSSNDSEESFSEIQSIEIAKKNISMILKRCPSVTQARVAKRLCMSPAGVSNWKNDDAKKCADILAELGLKVVPIQKQCYDPAFLSAVLVLARDRISHII